ncbi:hypothetical protein ABIB57_005374 [Devosia sp. UYZn731]|uniref:hypothetical protein n=1 Tax=Devosia sp. UYZn731 TaxID=3156345 RepID=UPI003397F885
MSIARKTVKLLLIAVLALGVATPVLQGVALAEQAVAPENNPPGDIPDSQVFIDYAGTGFTMKVPEGWSRNDTATGAIFTDKYNLLEASVAPGAAPTVKNATAGEVPAIEAGPRAAKVADVTAVTLDGGPAIRIQYESNSEPNAVTGKQIRLDRVRYLYAQAGNVVSLDMAAPKGADNVDQWLLMANSVTLQ